MKKLLCMLLALVMVLSLSIPAFADGYSTQVEYDPSAQNGGDTNGDGKVDSDDPAGSISETYTVIVPANVSPNGNGTVTAYGYWAVDKALTVTAAKTVTLTSTDATGSYTLNVTMNGAAATADEGGNTSTTDGVNPITVTNNAGNNSFTVGGSNVDNCYVTARVSVGNFTNAPLLGVWRGTFNYTVALA